MEILVPNFGYDKNSLAQDLGMEVFDVALPQKWLDMVCSELQLLAAKGKLKLDNDLSIYSRLLRGTVWCYDKATLFGEPVAITEDALELLNTYNREKHLPEIVVERIYRI